MGTNTPWPDAAVESLEVLWRQGLSASQISRALFDQLAVSYSRNAVIGKANRLGLNGRASPSRPISRRSLAERAPRVQAPKVEKPPAQKAPPPVPRPPETPPETARPWRTRKERECQWIYGDASADALTCCAPAVAGSPYCAAHARLIYQPQRIKALGYLVRQSA